MVVQKFSPSMLKSDQFITKKNDMNAIN